MSPIRDWESQERFNKKGIIEPFIRGTEEYCSGKNENNKTEVKNPGMFKELSNQGC